MRFVKKIVASLLCLCPCLALASCGQASSSVEPPEYIIEEYRGNPLSDEWMEVKEALYQQMFFDKGIYDDFAWRDIKCNAYHWKEEYNIIPGRYITINTFFLYTFYGEVNGGKIIDYLVNDMGKASGIRVPGYRLNGYLYECQAYIEPAYYKDGEIHGLQEACNLGLITQEEVFSIFPHEEQVGEYEYEWVRCYPDAYELKTPIEEDFDNYRANLPQVKYRNTDNFPSCDCSNGFCNGMNTSPGDYWAW